MKENLSSLNEVFKGAYLYGSKLLRGLVTAVFFLGSGSAVVLVTYQIAFESWSLHSSFQAQCLHCKGQINILTFLPL